MAAAENPPSRIHAPDGDELAAKIDTNTNLLARLILEERRRRQAGLAPEAAESGDATPAVRISLEQTSRLIQERSTPKGSPER